MMDLSIWTSIRLNFLLKFVQSQFWKNFNFSNGKLSKKILLREVLIKFILDLLTKLNEIEMNKIKYELAHLRQSVFMIRK